MLDYFFRGRRIIAEAPIEYAEPERDESAEPRKWCPDCEPEPNFLDNFYITCYCSAHWPSTEGSVLPPEEDVVPYLTEAGGEYNRRACQIIHRKS